MQYIIKTMANNIDFRQFAPHDFQGLMCPVSTQLCDLYCVCASERTHSEMVTFGSDTLTTYT